MIDDFIRAAAISRGTFYNHFHTVGELLTATSDNLTEELLQLIDAKLVDMTAPDLRIATALRLIGQKALKDRQWCAFLSRASHVGVHARLYLQRDLTQGQRTGVFDLPDVAAAFDLITGTTMQTLRAVESGQCRTLDDLRSYWQLIFRALEVPAARVERILCEPLPTLEQNDRAARVRNAPAPGAQANKRTSERHLGKQKRAKGAVDDRLGDDDPVVPPMVQAMRHLPNHSPAPFRASKHAVTVGYADDPPFQAKAQTRYFADSACRST